MNRFQRWFKGLGIAIGGAVALFPNNTTQAEHKVTNVEGLQQLFANSPTQAEHKVTNSEKSQKLCVNLAMQAEEKAMTYEKFYQFKKEVHDEIMGALRNTKLDEVFQKYGLVADKLIKFNSAFDLSQIEPDDAVGDEQIIDFLRAAPNDQLKITDCFWCQPGGCCECG